MTIASNSDPVVVSGFATADDYHTGQTDTIVSASCIDPFSTSRMLTIHLKCGEGEEKYLIFNKPATLMLAKILQEEILCRQA